MMRFIQDWFVQNPPVLALVSGVFFVLWLAVRNVEGVARPRALLGVASLWMAWAAWEWAVMTMSPEADIRFDLLLLIPASLLGSIAGLLLAIWPRKG